MGRVCRCGWIHAGCASGGAAPRTRPGCNRNRASVNGGGAADASVRGSGDYADRLGWQRGWRCGWQSWCRGRRHAAGLYSRSEGPFCIYRRAPAAGRRPHAAQSTGTQERAGPAGGYDADQRDCAAIFGDDGICRQRDGPQFHVHHRDRQSVSDCAACRDARRAEV